VEDVEQFRAVVKDIIREYASHGSSYGDIESEVIFDDANDHYELMRSGWHGTRRIHGSAIHIDIRGGKIWIQHDGTPDGIADILVERGIPKDHIVLAFHSPKMREYTEFAVT
jgi:hypothetical protein